jgi:putative FmdB family regulatory protein
MPLYDYQCTKCGHVIEVRHGFAEQHTGACPSCGGEMKRVINPAPIIFKGSGFYVTDSRKSTESKGNSSSESSSGGSSSGGKESAA